MNKTGNRLKRKTNAVTRNLSGELVLKKDRPFRVLQAGNHTVPTDVNGIHNFVFVNYFTLAKTAEEAT